MRVCVLSLAAALLFGVRGFTQASDDRAAVEKLVLTLQTGKDGAKRKAIQEIGNLGPRAKDAVPALTRIITEFPGGELDASAIVALGKIGPAAHTALPALHQRARSMFNSQREPVENACIAIGLIGGWSPATTRSILPLGMGNPAYFAANPNVTLPQLFDLLSDEDRKIRLGAMDAWRYLAEDRNDDVLNKQPKLRARVVEHATRTLDSQNPLERQHAANLFRTLVPDQADKVIPVLIRLLNERAITWHALDPMLSGRGDRGRVHDDLRDKALPSLIAAFADAPPAVHAGLVEYLVSNRFHNKIEWLPGALA